VQKNPVDVTASVIRNHFPDCVARVRGKAVTMGEVCVFF